MAEPHPLDETAKVHAKALAEINAHKKMNREKREKFFADRKHAMEKAAVAMKAGKPAPPVPDAEGKADTKSAPSPTADGGTVTTVGSNGPGGSSVGSDGPATGPGATDAGIAGANIGQ